ncbi:EamA family transporter [Paraflavitalea sp. CAU 1676]|uniref:DMT family transporter n=1 Tax=Paraflavitalea sp. CAU 1676 TaxID=3032598 RepID=UPI0023DCE3B8|nr:EamA family transporter [Paraflavitalea sp. CAU 1676]MDF2191115.1 EamA family transporter [Paraflavitalea sp. CAU 1676]
MTDKEATLNADKSKGLLLFAIGLAFAVLWSSAATATKIGLQSAQPFTICIARFFLAGGVMLLIAHVIMGKRLPRGKEWKQLCIYGLLNISLYLGIYIVAMQEVSPGLGSLAIATNPVFISLMSTILFGQRLKPATLISLLLCSAGVTLAAWPLIQHSMATPFGIGLLMSSMLIYSVGTLYFSRQPWSDLHILSINGWQTLLGGIFLLPVAAITFEPSKNVWDKHFFGSVLWLAIPVSIMAVQLWLYLLRDNAVKAAFWLFLCPVSGYIIANVMMKEPIGLYAIAGMLLVIVGLYLVQKKKAS